MISRIDGATNVGEIAEETGKSVEEVSALLDRLAAAGVLTLDSPQPNQERRPTPPPAARPSGAFRLNPIVETSSSAELKHPAAALYDPAELDESIEIDMERRRRILDLYYRLDQLDHYQIFGVDPRADKKAIKSAYFEIVNVFHPDRYFGKNVGSFKSKLEKVFSRLTQSYDVIARAASRAEYDAYLHAQSKTRAFDAGQSDSAAHQAALDEVMKRIAAEASAAARRGSVPPAPATPSFSSSAPEDPPPVRSDSGQRVSVSPPPRPSSNPALRPSNNVRPSDPEIRRRALARKLGRSSVMPPPISDKPVETPEQLAEQAQERQEWAAEELKRRYQDRVQAARDRQVEVYTRAAKESLAKGDTVGAANALRIAVSLSPSDSALADQLKEVSGKAKQELSASYLEQAEYEERDEKWLPAAKSYARALLGRPEARIYERVAHCLLSGEGDLKEAVEMAKKAVLLTPDSGRFRVTLARAFVKAGMKQSAEGELSRAATLAPNDDKVGDWIRRLKRELG